MYFHGQNGLICNQCMQSLPLSVLQKGCKALKKLPKYFAHASAIYGYPCYLQSNKVIGPTKLLQNWYVLVQMCKHECTACMYICMCYIQESHIVKYAVNCSKCI